MPKRSKQKELDYSDPDVAAVQKLKAQVADRRMTKAETNHAHTGTPSDRTMIKCGKFMVGID